MQGKIKGVGQPDMQSKTRCCLLFSVGGEFWRAIRYRVKILISLYPHCHSSCTALSLLYKASDAMMKGTVLGVFFVSLLLHFFLPFGVFCCFGFWFDLKNKKREKKPHMVTFFWVDIQNAKKANSLILV